MTTGVYAVINEELGQISYIGSSLTIEQRWRKQIWRLRKGVYEGKLQDSFNRLGVKAVSMEILEETSPEERWQREQYWLDLYQPECGRKNIRQQGIDGAEANSGRKLSEEHKKKIREGNVIRLQSDEMKDYLRELQTGKKFSEERKQKLRVPKRNLQGRTQSSDHIRKRVEAGLRTRQSKGVPTR